MSWAELARGLSGVATLLLFLWVLSRMLNLHVLEALTTGSQKEFSRWAGRISFGYSCALLIAGLFLVAKPAIVEDFCRVMNLPHVDSAPHLSERMGPWCVGASVFVFVLDLFMMAWFEKSGTRSGTEQG